MTRYVALFRGINIGGNKQVRMDELKMMLVSLGFRDVATYIQSGNVVFSAEEADKTNIERHIEEAFAQRFGFSSSVIVRNARELEECIANNPFQHDATKEAKWVLVVFLLSRPEDGALNILRETYAGREEFFLLGQELFIYYTEGVGRSKLTLPLIEKRLKTTGTGRNWNTVLQLQKMLS